VRSDRVVVLPPLLDDDLSFFQTVEDLSIEQLIAQLCCDIPASRQAIAVGLPCAIDTSIWRSSVTICSALNLFFGMTGSFPSSFSHNAWFKKARSGQGQDRPVPTRWYWPKSATRVFKTRHSPPTTFPHGCVYRKSGHQGHHRPDQGRASGDPERGFGRRSLDHHRGDGCQTWGHCWTERMTHSRVGFIAQKPDWFSGLSDGLV
jgi:hypothetical protein